VSNEEAIERLLRQYRELVSKLNQLNEAINEVGTDSEDMYPGHDEGQEFQAKMVRYQIYMEQIRIIREELRRLGYKKAL